MTAPVGDRLRILITGGCGFVGSHLAELLLDRGHRVTVLDDLSTGRLANVETLRGRSGFEVAVETVLNEIVLDRLVSECDVVFHLAAAVGVELIIRDPVHVIETNILGTTAVLKAAARYRRRVLLASSSEVYGKSDATPFSEDSDRVLGPTTRWRWSYSTSKAVDEYLGFAYHRQLGLPVTVFRLFNTVGPRQTGHYGMVVPRFVGQAVTGEPITVYGDGSQSRCFCDVRDVVGALAGLMDSPDADGGVFNIGSEAEVTILELARTVLRVVDELRPQSPAPQEGERIRLIPYEQAYEAGFEDMRRRVPDLGRIRDLLGWDPRIRLAETVADIVAEITAGA